MATGTKRPREDVVTEHDRSKMPKTASPPPPPSSQLPSSPSPPPPSSQPPYPPHFPPSTYAQLDLIAASSRTAFEKRVWTALCQIPRGSFTTYALLAAHLSSSPRAVGNALRRNPFAPDVPCHRVVATGRGLGGFKGQWPREGRQEGTTIDEKKRLLRGEGIRLDGKGRVVGTPFYGFV